MRFLQFVLFFSLFFSSLSMKSQDLFGEYENGCSEYFELYSDSTFLYRIERGFSLWAKGQWKVENHHLILMGEVIYDTVLPEGKAVIGYDPNLGSRKLNKDEYGAESIAVGYMSQLEDFSVKYTISGAYFHAPGFKPLDRHSYCLEFERRGEE